MASHTENIDLADKKLNWHCIELFSMNRLRQIPAGFVGLVWDRSGMAAKHSIHTFAGVIDSSYRGEICIVLKNFGSQDFHVTKNMRIAQLVIQPYLQVEITEGELDDTKRGESGFGSSGMH